jgi:peptide/nickel transport system permease protein
MGTSSTGANLVYTFYLFKIAELSHKLRFNMWAYLIRRLLYSVPILFGVSLVVFSLFNLVGGDPAVLLLGKHATAERVAVVRTELGLDRPKIIQFAEYLREVVTFDFGKSYTTREVIKDKIISGIGPTLSLTIPAFILTAFLSLTIALVVSYYRGRWIDRVSLMFFVLLMSLPGLAYILFGQYILASKLGWFPISGYSASWGERANYLALPVIISVLLNLGSDIRFFRNSIIEEVTQDYVRTARAKGLSEHLVYLKHVLKNSMIPVITYIVIQIPYLVLGSLLLESFFAIPGIGGMTVEAVNNSDFPVLKAMTTVISMVYIITTALTDVLYRLVDPRMSFGKKG